MIFRGKATLTPVIFRTVSSQWGLRRYVTKSHYKLGETVKLVFRLILICLCISIPSYTFAEGTGGGATGHYLKVDPPLVVNLGDGSGGIAFMQVNTQLKFDDTPEAQAKLTHHMPAIRHILIMLLSNQTVQDMKTAEGKNKMRDEALKEIQALMVEHTGKPMIEAIYFTGIVIQ